MRFEARELKSYGEYTRSSELKIGETYFEVNYLDHDAIVPEMIPLVFVGRNLDPEDSPDGSLLYFQDFSSYQAGDRYEKRVTSDPDQEPWIQSTEEREYSGVLEFEKALDILLECSLRRRGTAESSS